MLLHSSGKVRLQSDCSASVLLLGQDGDALGNTDALRSARSRANRQGDSFSAWDVIARIAAQRCGLPALKRLQPMPVLTLIATSAPTQDAVARYLLARTTGTPRDEAAHLCGIAISLATTLETELQRRKQ